MKYPVVFLCELMRVSKSGYYKWRSRQGKLNRYEQDRQLLTKLLREAHSKHPSYGYHMLARTVFQMTGWVFSHNLAHKCCKQAGIRSSARKHKYRSPGEESIKFENYNKDNILELINSIYKSILLCIYIIFSLSPLLLLVFQ